MALPNNPTQAQVVAEIKRLESDKYNASNPNGYTSNTGTVTSVGAGAGLSISGTASVNPTVNVASGYKLPTTTEWNAKANADSYLPLSAGSGKALMGDLYFDQSGQSQVIWKTSGTTTGLIRSGILNGTEKYIVQQADKHYWGNLANGNRIVFDPARKSLHSETNGTFDLGTSNNKWRNIYGVNVYATSDRRLKENIKDAELDCGAVIDELPIKEFNFKSDEEKKVVVGAIAQELQEILPEKYRATLVSGSEDTSYSINEGKLLYVAIGALKEERAKTKELEERLARLEAKLGV